MRALVLVPCPFLIMRGKPIRVLNNALALALEGHELVLATYAAGRDIADYLPAEFGEAGRRIEVRRAPRLFPMDPGRPGLSLGKLLNNLGLYVLARRLLKAQRFDAVICHDADGMLLGKLLRRPGLPMIYDMHGSLTELIRNIHPGRRLTMALARRVEPRLYAAADLILANWPHLLSEIGGAHADKVRLVQDRPPLTTAEPVPTAARGRWRREQGIERLLLYVGNFAAYQRVDLLIDMMGVLRDRGIGATLCLVGPGSESVEHRVADADIRLLGPRYGDDLARILASADVALSPRVTTNYPPMKVISYLKAAIPIVGTDCDAHRVMIEDGVTGLLVQATPEGFASAVEKLLADDALRARLRDAARRQAESYTMESLSEELRAALSGVAGPDATGLAEPDLSIRPWRGKRHTIPR